MSERERLLDEPEWFEDGVSERCHDGKAKSLPEAYRLGWEDCRDEAESEYKARARIAEQEKRGLVEALDTLVNRKWSIASPVHARPDNDEAATYLMCSVEKPVIDNARALLAKHEAGSG